MAIDQTINTDANLNTIVDLQDGSGNTLSSTSGSLNVNVTGVVPDTDQTAVGSIAALSALVAVNTNGCATLNINILGTFVATMVVQGTLDGTNWINLNLFSITSGYVSISSTSSVGAYYVPCAGFKQIRIISTAYTSGTANITMEASNGAGPYDQGLLQQIVTNTGAQATDFLVTGTISALNGSVQVNGQGVYTVTASITGTFVATLQAQGQLADDTWVQVPFYVVQTQVPYPLSFTVTTPATLIVTGGGYKNIRIIATSYTSGTINVGLDGSLSQQTIFASQLGTWNMGQYNASVQSYTTGSTVPLQTDVRGAVLTTPLDGSRQTYSAAALSVAPAAAPTDVFTITGSATKTIRVLEIGVSATSAANAIINCQLIKRSTANTGGTSAAATAVPHDSNNAAATATVLSYTANPTALGTTVGPVRTFKLLSDATTTATQDLQIFIFGDNPGQAVVLRGTAQVFAVNLNSATLGGGNLDVYVTWSEE